MSKRRSEPLGRMARMWFALAPIERAVLLGILAVALVGLTARRLHQRMSAAGEAMPAVSGEGTILEEGASDE